MKSEEDKINIVDSQERLTMQELFALQADIKAKTAYEKKLEQEKITFELHSGQKTSVFAEKEKIRKIMADLPQNYEPKFAMFFPALGKLAGWSEDILKAYHKPPIAAQTINEVIYNRFPKNVVEHIHEKNPYIKWCFREHKNYRFLGEDGILLLETFIDDAVMLMAVSDSIYEFRIKHAEKYGTGFQPDLFAGYFESAQIPGVYN